MLHFGQLIKKIAEEKGLSAQELARKVKKSKITVYRDYQKLDLNTQSLREYCKALNIDITTLFINASDVTKTLEQTKRELEIVRKELQETRSYASRQEELIDLFKENKKLKEEKEKKKSNDEE